ncbi:MAG: hypothetical protein KatS3mg022_0622 [Armatimonadota bacterium]|nr:MAG: hypothetical protein KatS3mg022_0622 [Armatimonadota bacterium]
MARTYQHLGVYSDWVDSAKKAHNLYPVAPPGKKTQQRVREILGFHFNDEHPREVQVERRWTRDGLEGEEVSWSVGYGPRTHAWVLKPEGAKEPCPLCSPCTTMVDSNITVKRKSPMDRTTRLPC